MIILLSIILINKLVFHYSLDIMKRERSDSLNNNHMENDIIRQSYYNHKNFSPTATNEKVDNSNNTAVRNGIICNESPCENNFILLEFYPSHVENYHNNRCSKCKQNFISNHILNLHIDECHNPFLNEFDNLKCFEVHCNETFENHNERIKHLIKKHDYPSFFDFDMIFSGY